MAQRVEKLDNPEIFNAIPSGHKTIAGLKHYEKAKFNSLFPQFKFLGMFGLTEADRTKLGWFASNWFEIIEYEKECMSRRNSRPQRFEATWTPSPTYFCTMTKRNSNPLSEVCLIRDYRCSRESTSLLSKRRRTSYHTRSSPANANNSR